MAEVRKRRKLSNGDYEAVETEKEDAQVEPQSAEKKDQRRSLFVRSLPASITTERLTEHFSQSYPLKHATVVVDPKTKTPRGFGFVTFTDPEDAQAAAAEFNNTVIDGRKIKVEVAESRHRETVLEGGKSGPNTKAVELRAEREKQRTELQPPKLIVRNLPWSIKEPEDLALLFRSYGKVKHAVVPKRSPKVQAGFGFVVLKGRKNAEKALEGINGKEVDGRTLAVDWAVDKKTWEDLRTEEAEAEEDTGEKHVDDNAEEQRNGTSAGIGVEDAASGDGVATDSSHIIGEDEPMEDGAEDEIDDESANESEEDQNSTTIFIRNLPFTATDETLKEHFTPLGPVRYARVVFDPETERSKGTGFVCFFNEADAKSCVKNAPKHEIPATPSADKKRRGEMMTHSVLQNEATDPSGQYTFEGRVLQVSRALSRENATKRADEASSKRDVRDRDKRRLYLLSEGNVGPSSKLYSQLGKSEIDIRDSSARQRQKLLKTNPNLCMSLTRLSVRNIPRNIDSKELKALAREAVVGFATDVKAGLRQPLSKEELTRGGEAMKEAERKRKQKGVGIVTQAKIVFEGREGMKVKETSGAGRSRGYGFIEYVSHRNALMGLRWLNGHVVKSNGGEGERSKRLIVEFAIENAQVVQRRDERETKARLGPRREPRKDKDEKRGAGKPGRKGEKTSRGQKRKLDDSSDMGGDKAKAKSKAETESEPVGEDEKNKLAMRNRIIGRKRHMRKSRKG